MFQQLSPTEIRKEMLSEVEKCDEVLLISRRKDGTITVNSLGDDKLVIWGLAKTMMSTIDRDFGAR